MLSALLEHLLSGLWNGCRERLVGSMHVPEHAKSSENAILIGHTLPSLRNTPGTQEREPVFLLEPEWQKQMRVIGASGSGKSNFLLLLTTAILTRGTYTLVVIDYLSDGIDRILAWLASKYHPADLSERLLVFDHRRDDWLIPFNPLQAEDPYTAALFLLEAIKKRSSTWGVTIEQALLYVLIALSEAGGCVLDILPVLENEHLRKQILGTVQDPEVQRWFTYFENMDSRDRNALIASIANKLTPFTGVKKLRNVFGVRTGIDFREQLDTPGKIILICLPGDRQSTTAKELGSMYFAAIQAAILARASQPEAERQPLLCVMDEFGFFTDTNAEFETLITNGRRLKAHLVLAHQSMAQLDPKLRAIVRGVGADVWFAVAAPDSNEIYRDINTHLDPNTVRSLLMNQGPGQAFLIRRGKPCVHLQTLAYTDPKVTPKAVEAVRLASWNRWAIPLGDRAPTQDVQPSPAPDMDERAKRDTEPLTPSPTEIIDHDATRPQRPQRRPKQP